MLSNFCLYSPCSIWYIVFSKFVHTVPYLLFRLWYWHHVFLLLEKVAARGRALFRLFQHPSLTIVKGAGLIMKALIEEGEPEIGVKMQASYSNMIRFIVSFEMVLFMHSGLNFSLVFMLWLNDCNRKYFIVLLNELFFFRLLASYSA